MPKWRKKDGCCRFAEKVSSLIAKSQPGATAGPLSCGKRRGRVKVCKVTGDRKTCARMASLGVYPGVEADIICAEGGQQCVLKVHGGTISLDSDISANILVTQL